MAPPDPFDAAAELVAQVRRADDQSAARDGALLGRDARDGPAAVTSAPPGRPHHHESSPLPSHREGSDDRMVARAGESPEVPR